MDVTAGAYLFMAAGFLLLPLHWLICAVFAALFHELGHLIALHICNVPVYKIRFGFFGAQIITGSITALQEMVCAIAGPVFSLILLFFTGKYPALVLFGLCQGLFNLLPIPPMDGGRVLISGWRLIRDHDWKEKFLEK